MDWTWLQIYFFNLNAKTSYVWFITNSVCGIDNKFKNSNVTDEIFIIQRQADKNDQENRLSMK